MSIFQVLLLGVAGVSAAVVHYPPSSTNVNNLTFVLQGTGAPGIFNSSTTPNKEYGIYNWCNMPHVRTREYLYVTTPILNQ
jgi:acid phosphatase